MRIRVICIGLLKDSAELTLIQTYKKRFHWQLDIMEIPPKKGLSGQTLKEYEAKQILNLVPNESTLIALDERGVSFSSPDFAKIISQYQNQGQSTLYFCIGGADGLHESIRERANQLICFGKMTWPHMLARVLLIEQLYRAQQILSNHPYHKS